MERDQYPLRRTSFKGARGYRTRTTPCLRWVHSRLNSGPLLSPKRCPLVGTFQLA